MNDSLDNEALLGRFRQWLEETRREADGAAGGCGGFGRARRRRGPSGCCNWSEEFTALRHEVKLQTKSSRGVAERTEQALAAMQQAIELFRSVEAKETEAGQRAAKPLVESLIELDEALGRGRAVIDAARRRMLEDLAGHIQEQLDDLLLRLPVWRRWLCRSWCRRARDILIQRIGLTYRDIFDSLVEGYDLILGRLQRAMKKAELYRIECVGRQVDPNLMTVVEVVDDPLRPPGLVVDQIRPGLLLEGQSHPFRGGSRRARADGLLSHHPLTTIHPTTTHGNHSRNRPGHHQQRGGRDPQRQGGSAVSRTARRFCRRSSGWMPTAGCWSALRPATSGSWPPSGPSGRSSARWARPIPSGWAISSTRRRKSRPSSCGRSKERAEKQLGQSVRKAVITVPAFFNETQREATREAGELAGLEVVRIINEPTAASLTYDPHPDKMERLLVYDLGGGTFDVSIVQIEQGVVEVLTSHGDTHLGGDDFDQLLLDFVCEDFLREHGIDLRQSLVAKSRVLRAVEEAKKRLSSEPAVRSRRSSSPRNRARRCTSAGNSAAATTKT